MTWFNSYVGLPYLHLGRTADGADCYGLIRLVQSEVFDVKMPELTTESAATPRALTRQFLSLRRDWVKVEQEEAGDVVILRPAGQPNHVGVCIGIDSLFLHTEPVKNACIESMRSILWKNTIDSMWRHKSKCLHR